MEPLHISYTAFLTLRKIWISTTMMYRPVVLLSKMFYLCSQSTIEHTCRNNTTTKKKLQRVFEFSHINYESVHRVRLPLGDCSFPNAEKQSAQGDGIPLHLHGHGSPLENLCTRGPPITRLFDVLNFMYFYLSNRLVFFNTINLPYMIFCCKTTSSIKSTYC